VIPNYNKTLEASYSEEQDLQQDYNYFAKPVSYENYTCSPLHPTRQSTDVTETNDPSPFIRKGYSPNSGSFQRNNGSEFHAGLSQVNNSNLQGNKSKFVAVFGATTGIAYSGFGGAGNPPIPQENIYYGNPLENNNPGVLKKVLDEEEDHDEESGSGREDYQEIEQNFGLNTQLKSLMESNIWDKEKDHLLLKLGQQYKCDWKKVARRFNHKKLTPHFLKTRYKELTCAPIQRRIKFNHKEDLMIVKYFDKYGSNWAQMATHFQDRTAIMLKNRYYSYIRKRELLEPLLNEVKEIEKGKVEVDQMTCLESQETDESLIKREPRANNDPNSEIENSSKVMAEPIFHDDSNEKASSDVYYGGQQNHSIFPYNYSVGTKLEEPFANHQNLDTKCGKEVDTLKAKIKSLQTLYLETKAELEKMKAMKENK
jgi:hypothetical protein